MNPADATLGQGATPARALRAALAALALCLGSGCGQPSQESGPPAAAGRIEVVCTTGMVADLAREIGGKQLRVTGLMGPGVDPHYYKASQGDMRRLEKADLILYNGLFLEGKMEDIFEKMASKKRVLAVASDIPRELLRKPPEFKGHYDPHIWFDVALWRRTLPPVVAVLKEMSPENADTFERRAADFGRRLEALHEWVGTQMAEVPEGRRVLVTAHDAFGYFGKAYGAEVVGLQGISTVSDYGINDVNRIVDLIVARGVKAIFVESSVPERSIRAVQEGCRARGSDVVVGGTLYSDAMGEKGSGADFYEGMVRHNVNTIVAALK